MPPQIKVYANLDEAPQRGYRIFCYGDWGAGKTVLMRGAPNSLLIDTEGSRVALKNHPELARLPLAIAEDSETLNAIVDRISKTSTGIGEFDTYIVDTVSAIRTTSITTSVMKAQGRHLASMAEYSEANQLLAQMLQLCKLRPEKNWIFIAHMALEKNTRGEVIQTRPSLGEATIQAFGQVCDVVMYLRARESTTGSVDRELFTRVKATENQGTIMTKNRLALPPVIKNPTSAELFEMIERQHNRRVTEP